MNPAERAYLPNISSGRKGHCKADENLSQGVDKPLFQMDIWSSHADIGKSQANISVEVTSIGYLEGERGPSRDEGSHIMDVW